MARHSDMQAAAKIAIDAPPDDGLRIPDRAVSGAQCTQDCGSHSALRWYCAQYRPGQLALAELCLADQGFETWSPLRSTEIRRARKTVTVLRPVFIGYLFIRFDVAQDRWRAICHTRGVARLFSTAPERPLPIRPGVIESLQAEQVATGFLPRPVDSLVKAGATVRISTMLSPFEGQVGPVLAVDAAGVHVQVALFGRDVRLVFAEADLALVKAA